MENQNRIPVTIITGFLGSGKTTLINQLIKQHSNKKFAIIENEFGEIGIDGSLILGADENIFELSNGCICCSIHKGFHDTVLQLRDSDYPFDHLLIETTGIADPDTIIQAFISSEEIQMAFQLDSVVCIADAQHLENYIDELPEAKKQLSLADVVIINKVDTVQAEEQTRLHQVIKTLNPFATIYPVQFAELNNINLLNRQAFSAESIERATALFMENIRESTNEHTNKNRHKMQSVSFTITDNFDLGQFGLWMHNFLRLNRDSIFRSKGILSFQDRPEKFIFQAVRDNFMFDRAGNWEQEERQSQLIFIGKNINKEQIKNSLNKLIIKKDAKLYS